MLQIRRRRVEIDKPNERSEAYTGNHAGRKGDPHFPDDHIAPFMTNQEIVELLNTTTTQLPQSTGGYLPPNPAPASDG